MRLLFVLGLAAHHFKYIFIEVNMNSEYPTLVTFKMFIMRGISGSGKSTKAREIMAKENSCGNAAIICSADDFFMASGKYKFDASKLGQAHAWCRQVEQGR